MARAGRGVYGNAGAWYLDHQLLVINDASVGRWQVDTGGAMTLLEELPRPE
jgi:UDP-2,3-diacylglucosamine hydrolase